ncbi:MAG: PAS domain-containing protein [Solirubrobacteraceae bacterium]
MLESLPDPVIGCDFEGAILYWSPAAGRHLRVPGASRDSGTKCAEKRRVLSQSRRFGNRWPARRFATGRHSPSSSSSPDIANTRSSTRRRSSAR